jgi:phage terminase large subunit
VDDTGLGGGVTDRLREVNLNGTNVIAFKGGENAQASDRFSNKIAEAWWVMRDWVIAGGRVPNDDALIGQMSSRGYTIQSDRKIALEKKIKMSKSPDEADALAMAIYSGYAKAGFGVW